MASVALRLRYSPHSSSSSSNHSPTKSRFTIQPFNHSRFSSPSLLLSRASSASNPSIDLKPPPPPPDLAHDGGDGGGNGRGGWSSGGGNGGGGGGESEDHHSRRSGEEFGVIGLFLQGWRSRVSADPQFPFKVLMEELVGVSACVLGDMASRPNFGLNELDFVFSTLVVGSILNFVLMYLLAPTMASASAATATTAAATTASSSLVAIFANCPKSHMFEPGAFTAIDRIGTFVYKGAVFAAVGFAAGLVGTAISNGLIAMRKKMDPGFAPQNEAPPPMLNALTWAAHMGLSSNLRYQTLNGIEFVLAKGLPPLMFKSSVVVLRCLNNVLGGVSFVVLARLTGSQKVEESGNGKALLAEQSGKQDGSDGRTKLEEEQ